MNEREGREFYQAHKDDPAVWGEPVLVKRASRQLDSMVSVRLTADEVACIRYKAEAMGLSISAFLRSTALREAALPTVRVTNPPLGPRR